LNEKFTLRSLRGFNPMIACKFSNILYYSDLPYNFNLNVFELLRYKASFFGYNYNKNSYSYNL
jgi:hypothetical protein